jgi:methionine-rich copper-binding protein CopC
MKRLFALILGSTLAFALHAHTKLATTSPTADASVTAPHALELTFEGEVRLTAVALADAAGRTKHLDAVPTQVGNKFSLAIHEPLTAGKYTVTWRAVGGDTHIISGEFVFTVTAP